MNTEKVKQAMAQLAALNAKIASNSACNVSSEENHANAIEIVLDALQSFLELGITPEQIREIDKLYAEKCMELSEEKKKHRWIPCSERLPDEAFGCLVTVMDCEPSTQTDFENILPYFVGYDGHRWNDADGEEIPFEVIAWRKLPTPYQPKGE